MVALKRRLVAVDERYVHRVGEEPAENQELLWI